MVENGEHGLLKLGNTSCLSLDWVAAYGRTESDASAMDWTQDSLQLNTRLSWNKKLGERLCMSIFGGLEYFSTSSEAVDGVKTGNIRNLRAELRYLNDMVRDNPEVEMDGLRGEGENPGRSGMGLEAGATYRINERWSTSANYSFNALEDSREHRLNVGASYTF